MRSVRTFGGWGVVLVLVAGRAAAGQVVTADNAGTARNGKVGCWPSIVAGGGAEAVSYFCEGDTIPAPGGTHYALRFAWKDAGVWRWTNVNNNAGGNDSCMARGSDGVYNIAWASWSGVRWARGSGAGWTVSPARVDAGVQQPSRISIVMDGQNRPHVAYMEASPGQNRGLHYTMWNGSAWTRGSSELAAAGVWNTSIGNTFLALDTGGNPALAYTQGPDTGLGDLRFARLVGGAWQVESLGVQAYDASLVIGTDNVARVMYLQDSGVRYAEKVGGVWRTETVSDFPWCASLAMALGGGNVPYASLRVDNDVYVARRATAGWVLERLDQGDPGVPNFIMAPLGSSLGVDENGVAHVAYAAMFMMDNQGGFREDLRVAGSAVTGQPCMVISGQPAGVASCPHGTAAFTVAAAESGAGYAWEASVDGSVFTPLVEGSNALAGGDRLFAAAGTVAGRLELTAPDQEHFRLSDLVVRCRVTVSCGSEVSGTAELRVCPADVNCDGFLDFFDYDDFVGDFEEGRDAADFNADGFLDFFDYDGFVSAFEEGC